VAAIAAPEFHWREAVPGYRFSFPRDHFEHPDYRTEWWYYTGNVADAKGSRFGFELVFFRQGQRRGADPNESAWRIDDMYLAHAALTQVNGRRFFYDERLNRAGPGIAGANFGLRRVWNGNWSSQWTDEKQLLSAFATDFTFKLQLTLLKAPIINGIDGISQKAEGRGKASYYVSLTRLAVTGSIEVGGIHYDVTGTSWMDHEWFSHQLESGQLGWDWFSAQFDDYTELMLFQLRREDGSIDRYSSGTFIDRLGKAHHLAAKDFHLTPLEKWTRYPVHWSIELPFLKMQLDCRAVIQNQELKASKGGTTYWEGAVNYSGSAHGVGYLEMTGYDRAVEF
jgi:predicted secreted hydrolase